MKPFDSLIGYLADVCSRILSVIDSRKENNMRAAAAPYTEMTSHLFAMRFYAFTPFIL